VGGLVHAGAMGSSGKGALLHGGGIGSVSRSALLLGIVACFAMVGSVSGGWVWGTAGADCDAACGAGSGACDSGLARTQGVTSATKMQFAVAVSDNTNMCSQGYKRSHVLFVERVLPLLQIPLVSSNHSLPLTHCSGTDHPTPLVGWACLHRARPIASSTPPSGKI
jgi:hypothetical protein